MQEHLMLKFVLFFFFKAELWSLRSFTLTFNFRELPVLLCFVKF